MTGEEPKIILEHIMKFADITYNRQCVYMSLLRTYSCEMCPLRTQGLHCYASEFIRGEKEVLR